MSVPSESVLTRNPLFYINPQPLGPDAFGNWRMKGGNAAFSADAIGMPVVIGEFADISRNYPILFAAGDDNGPIALTGLVNRNLFVRNGEWAEHTYIPAYMRRYPFALAGIKDEPERLLLIIDAASDFLAKDGTEGTPLFENGQPSQFTKDAMAFCENWQREVVGTHDFRNALRDKGLLVDRRIDGKFPDGTPFAVDGFQIIDAQKFTDLDAETLAAWHRRGWLASAYYHLASLGRVNDLINRHVQLAAN